LADHFKERHELDRFKFTDKLPRPLLRQPADGGHLCTVRVVTASLLYPSPKLDDARLPGQRTMARPSQCVDCALLKSAKEVGMPAPSPDPMAMLRSRTYVRLLVLAAVLGVPISAVAYGFLALVASLQDWLFSDLPKALGFDGAPRWWPLPMLTLAGVLGALIIRYLPGNGGHSPADGFKTGGVPTAIELPGIAIAALAALSLGLVAGPEAPLIALGAGLAGWAVRLARRDTPAQATAMVVAAGSFAAGWQGSRLLRLTVRAR
jgi:hypothetical protein